MTYKIKDVENSDIIKVTYKGDVSLDERISVVHELCIDYKRNTQFKLLIDARLLTSAITPTEQSVFGTYIASREEFLLAKVAVIIDTEHVINKIILEKSLLLGHQIRVFNRENEAIAWLNN